MNLIKVKSCVVLPYAEESIALVSDQYDQTSYLGSSEFDQFDQTSYLESI